MARLLQYFVAFADNQWMISYGGRHFGPFTTQRGAIRAAVDAAHRAGGDGDTSQVLVQGTDSRFRAEWTYGYDPYPPPG